MLFLMHSSSAAASLKPLQGSQRMPSATWAPCCKGFAHALFSPNVQAGNSGMQAARIYSTLHPDQDLDDKEWQTHSLDIARDKFMHISISPALKIRTVGPHYQQARENLPHLVPGAMLMWDKIYRWIFFSCSVYSLFNINTLGLPLGTCCSPFVSHSVTHADIGKIYLLFSSN